MQLTGWISGGESNRPYFLHIGTIGYRRDQVFIVPKNCGFAFDDGNCAVWPINRFPGMLKSIGATNSMNLCYRSCTKKIIRVALLSHVFRSELFSM